MARIRPRGPVGGGHGPSGGRATRYDTEAAAATFGTRGGTEPRRPVTDTSCSVAQRSKTQRIRTGSYLGPAKMG